MATPPPLLGARYEVTAPLGSGGMADVFRARDRVLSRDVAVKVLRATSDVDRERFASEARILALLSHEAIVTVYDAGIEDEQPWLALELVVGMTLRDAYGDGRPPADPRVLAAIGAQVAGGLAHAHERGVVHRDVKPANVLLTPGDRARLTDFGIARLIDSDAQLTLTGTTIGTAAYLAPEQVRGGPITGAADVYALGLVLLEALTGRRSYDGTAVEAAMARLHHGPLIPTSLPVGWPGLLTAMTASDPADRPSADAAATRLRELAADTPAAAPMTEITSAHAVTGVPQDGRRRRWPAVAAAAVVAGLVLAASALLVGADQPTVADSRGAVPTSQRPARQAQPTVTPIPTPSARPADTAATTRDRAGSSRDVAAGPPATAPGAKAGKHQGPAKQGAGAPGKGKPNHAKGKGKSKGTGKGKGKGR